MIAGTHSILYADDADQARAFLRDVLGLGHVDVGDGWLIFRLPPGELGVHPAGEAGPSSGRHELFLLCDDIEGTITELTAKDVEFTTAVSDEGWGLLTMMRIPGGVEIGLYQPRHPTATDL